MQEAMEAESTTLYTLLFLYMPSPAPQKPSKEGGQKQV